MSTDKDIWLQCYLDGELSDEDERHALHLIADDPELRALLKFDLGLRQSLSTDSPAEHSPPSSVSDNESSVSIPEGFFDGVMEAIAQQEERQETQISGSYKVDRIDWITTLRNRFWQPRNVAWRPVWSVGIAAALLLIILMSPVITTSLQQQPDTPTLTGAHQIVYSTRNVSMVRFKFIDKDAESIAIAGDFNEWDPVYLSRATISGNNGEVVVWVGDVVLPRGKEHIYMFLKDGEQWTTDPFAPHYVENEFGINPPALKL